MTDSLKHHFLVAMPGLDDDNFARTVTYICQHDGQGAMGIVVNKPSTLTVKGLLDHLELPCRAHHSVPVLEGGPVGRQNGFVLHTASTGSDVSLDLGHGVYLSTAKEMLAAIGKGEGPDRWLIALGYASWGEGQLEAEIGDNAWLTCPASLSVLFDVPFEARVLQAAAILGIDFNLISSRPGYA